ncbi:MAG: NAD(P)H-hydrate dehydratase [Eggerthellaceae bacterium]|nr:NAD(P)H-hydrate dehydratase [Eggerthellaceae bacterium]
MDSSTRRTIPPTDAFRDEWLALQLPYPTPDANKYSRGKLFAFAGSETYPGAALLAADAALISGAGYVQVVTDKSVIPLVIAHRPSVVATDFSDWTTDKYQSSRTGKPCAYLVGSGFDSNDAALRRRVFDVLAHSKAPVLVDGGGLSFLTSFDAKALLESRGKQGYPTVLTPHAGEAARLCTSFAGDDEALARKLANDYRATVALKGPVTYICDGENLYRMDKGTSALAKAGTGDVLAGMIGAFLAQGLEPFTACALGCRVHAQAGREAAAKVTAICVTAEDVIEAIPEAIRVVRSFAERTISV